MATPNIDRMAAEGSVPVQEKLKAFLSTLSEYPFQQASSLSGAGINYNSLQGMQVM